MLFYKTTYACVCVYVCARARACVCVLELKTSKVKLELAADLADTWLTPNCHLEHSTRGSTSSLSLARRIQVRFEIFWNIFFNTWWTLRPTSQNIRGSLYVQKTLRVEVRSSSNRSKSICFEVHCSSGESRDVVACPELAGERLDNNKLPIFFNCSCTKMIADVMWHRRVFNGAFPI